MTDPRPKHPVVRWVVLASALVAGTATLLTSYDVIADRVRKIVVKPPAPPPPPVAIPIVGEEWQSYDDGDEYRIGFPVGWSVRKVPVGGTGWDTISPPPGSAADVRGLKIEIVAGAGETVGEFSHGIDKRFAPKLPENGQNMRPSLAELAERLRLDQVEEFGPSKFEQESYREVKSYSQLASEEKHGTIHGVLVPFKQKNRTGLILGFVQQQVLGDEDYEADPSHDLITITIRCTSRNLPMDELMVNCDRFFRRLEIDDPSLEGPEPDAAVNTTVASEHKS